MGLDFDYYDLTTLPHIHTIVWCRVLEPGQELPGNTLIPTLIRETKKDETTGRGGLLVCYGTEKLQVVERGHIDFIIQNAGRMRELGLPTAVRFNLDLKNWLPWAYQFFTSPPHWPSTIAGILTEDEKDRLRVKLLRRGELRPM